MKIEWPKGFMEWALALSLILGITRMYLFEHPTSFQFLVILLLLHICVLIRKNKVVTNINIAERK